MMCEVKEGALGNLCFMDDYRITINFCYHYGDIIRLVLCGCDGWLLLLSLVQNDAVFSIHRPDITWLLGR
jgi:hypothetical protein